MQSSWEVLTLLLEVMGAVMGGAVSLVAVYLVVKDPGARKAVARVSAAAMTLGYCVCGIVAEYAKEITFVSSHHLLNKGRKIARAILE